MDLKVAILLSFVAAIVECQFVYVNPYNSPNIQYVLPDRLQFNQNQQSIHKDRRPPIIPSTSSYDQYQNNGGFQLNKEQQYTPSQIRPLNANPTQINSQQLPQKTSPSFQPIKKVHEVTYVVEPERDLQHFRIQEVGPEPNSNSKQNEFIKKPERIPNNQLAADKISNRKKNPSHAPNINAEPEIKFENYQPVTDFSWNFFKSTINNNDNPNAVVCPLSPQLLLSYIAYGASGNTKQEIVNAIRYNGPSQLNALIKNMLVNPGKKEFQLATAMFMSDKLNLKPSFSRVLENNADIVSTDFTNAEAFNRNYGRWITQKTKGELSAVRTSFHPATKMVMSSAVYYKGDWIFKLYPAGQGIFITGQGKPVNVDMMSLQRKLPYGKISDYAEWLGLPYDSNETMIIAMPNKGVKLEEMIRQININDLLDSMNHDNYGNVTLRMPKFKVESKISLVNPLQQMGIREIFTPNAELPNMLDSKEPLAISNFIQQSSLEVNEQGSIATSVTSFSVIALSFTPPTPNVEFIVDRPFIAMIVDRNFNFPYFIAKITNPSS